MEEPPETAKVLVVDDHEPVLKIVQGVLERERYQVLLARDGAQALQAAIEHSPHLIILDLSLPALSGLEVCRQLRTWYQAPILILSGHGEESTIVETLDLGADDFLTKPFRPLELLARIRALLRRFQEQPNRSAVIRAGALELDLARRRVHRNGEEIRLTRTEFDILAYLARNLDRVVTSTMILQAVWGPHHGEYAQTLRVHMGHIRKKVEPDPPNPVYILTEPGVGYRLSVPGEDNQSGGQALSFGP